MDVTGSPEYNSYGYRNKKYGAESGSYDANDVNSQSSAPPTSSYNYDGGFNHSSAYTGQTQDLSGANNINP